MRMKKERKHLFMYEATGFYCNPVAQCVDKVNLSLRYAKPVLIVVEGAQTSAGGRDKEDPAGRKPEEASGPPAKSEAPGTKINCSNR